MWGMAICSHKGVRKGDTVLCMYNGRHSFQIDLVHDAVARRNDVNVLERCFGPINEMEAVVVAAIFDGPVFLEGVFFEAGMLDS